MHCQEVRVPTGWTPSMVIALADVFWHDHKQGIPREVADSRVGSFVAKEKDKAVPELQKTPTGEMRRKNQVIVHAPCKPRTMGNKQYFCSRCNVEIFKPTPYAYAIKYCSECRVIVDKEQYAAMKAKEREKRRTEREHIAALKPPKPNGPSLGKPAKEPKAPRPPRPPKAPRLPIVRDAMTCEAVDCDVQFVPVKAQRFCSTGCQERTKNFNRRQSRVDKRNGDVKVAPLVECAAKKCTNTFLQTNKLRLCCSNACASKYANQKVRDAQKEATR